MLALVTFLAAAPMTVSMEASTSAGGLALAQDGTAREFRDRALFGVAASLRARPVSWFEVGLGVAGHYIPSSDGGSSSRFELQGRLRTPRSSCLFFEVAVGIMRIGYSASAPSDGGRVSGEIDASMPFLRAGFGGIFDLGPIGLVTQLSALATTGGDTSTNDSRVSGGTVVNGFGAFAEVGVRIEL